MSKIETTLYKDNNEAYPDGCSVFVSIKSKVLGIEKNVLLVNHPIEACDHSAPRKDLLKIQDPDKGFMYIDETPNSFANKINEILVGGKTKSVEMSVGAGAGEIPAGTNLYTADWLKGITMHRIQYAGTEYVSFYGGSPQIAHDPVAGTLDFTSITGGAGLEDIEEPLGFLYEG